jgi:RND family efflux transporter MFP subunit
MEQSDLDRLTIEKGAKEKQARRRKRSRFTLVAVPAVLIVLVFIAWILLTRGTAVHVTTVNEVYPSQLLSRISASGYVVAQRKADVGTKVTGQLVSLSVREGSIVKTGQVMATIENDDAKAFVEQGRANLNVARQQVRQAQANLEDARLNYTRMKNLVQRGSVSRSEFDAATTRYHASEAAYEGALAGVKASEAAFRNAEVSLGYTEIRAPFDAVVLTKNADVGDIITPIGASTSSKAAVVSIADLSSLQVEADVSEANIGMVSVGQPCDITLDALPGARFEGTVDTIVPTVDRSKATVLVKVRFARRDPRILPEMSSKVGFLSRPLKDSEKRPRVMVSAMAVRKVGGGQVIFLVQGTKAEERQVRTGESFGDMVEVLQGAKPGDVAVSNPPEGLRDGAKVTILEK